ncbi:MAG: PAC2 family protein [Ilumatobacteraceae bacterium]
MSDDYHYVGGDPSAFTAPTMVVMLTGWIDASGAAAAAMSALESETKATTIATFDGDVFIDYRARRPTMQLRDGVNSRLVWPAIEVKAGQDALGRDVLLLTGPEPDMAWRRFGKAVAEFAQVLGVARLVALGSYPFASPHTRPSRLSMSSPSVLLAESLPLAKSSVDVPAGVAAVLEHSLHDVGIDALGLWVQVPHYVASMAYPAATVALLGGLADFGEVLIDGSAARQETIIQRERLDELVAGNEEHQAMVLQLESLYDAISRSVSDGDGDPSPSGSPLSASEIPTADELGAEFEQFLRDQNNG